jgi:hypothetical protein
MKGMIELERDQRVTHLRLGAVSMIDDSHGNVIDGPPRATVWASGKHW